MKNRHRVDGLGLMVTFKSVECSCRWVFMCRGEVALYKNLVFQWSALPALKRTNGGCRRCNLEVPSL